MNRQPRATARVLLLPGLNNSGPEHWQSRWEAAFPGYVRVQQHDWDHPRCEDWVAGLAAAVAEHGSHVVLAAHSLACTLVIHWARQTGQVVKGALLVAPSDVEAPSYPAGTQGFSPMPLTRLAFPSIVVASSDDEYVALERAGAFAEAWGSRLVNVGPRGHLNSASHLGLWPQGHGLLEQLLAAEGRPQ
jgi:predicted alpha/beta hydrolase family esterase